MKPLAFFLLLPYHVKHQTQWSGVRGAFVGQQMLLMGWRRKRQAPHYISKIGHTVTWPVIWPDGQGIPKERIRAGLSCTFPPNILFFAGGQAMVWSHKVSISILPLCSARWWVLFWLLLLKSLCVLHLTADNIPNPQKWPPELRLDTIIGQTQSAQTQSHHGIPTRQREQRKPSSCTHQKNLLVLAKRAWGATSDLSQQNSPLKDKSLTNLRQLMDAAATCRAA